MDITNAIVSKWAYLLANLQPDSIVSYLNERKILPTVVVEKLAAAGSGRALSECLLLCVLACIDTHPRVQPAFWQALDATNQGNISKLLRKLTGNIPNLHIQIGDNNVMTIGNKPKFKSLTREPVFKSLINSVRALKPASTLTERHGIVYLTSTVTSTDSPPVSNLGAREIPYLIAALGCGYSHATVLSWKDAPSKAEFNRSYAIYQSEVSEAIELIKLLGDGGGIHLSVDITDARLEFLRKITRSYLKLSLDRQLSLIIDRVAVDSISLQDQRLIGCLIHLMCFGNYSFIIRRSFAPKPNCYLLFRAIKLNPVVVAASDASIVAEAIRMDESVDIDIVPTAPCPWLL